MNTAELQYYLSGLASSKRINTYFINGAPGSGKTKLLNELLAVLPQTIPGSHVLGPYIAGTPDKFNREFLSDLSDGAYIDEQPPDDAGLELGSTWQWLRENLHTSLNETIIILLDTNPEDLRDMDFVRQWFSSLRNIEVLMDDVLARILIVLVGYWDPYQLEDFYREKNISFPYTHGHNYQVWDGITIGDVNNLLKARFPDVQDQNPMDCLLFELSGGHPGVIEEVLEVIPDEDNLNLSEVLNVVEEMAKIGVVGNRFASTWAALAGEARLVIRDLLQSHQVPYNNVSPYCESLRAAGVVEIKSINQMQYLVFKSWFVELTARYHLVELGIENKDLSKIRTKDLVPAIKSLNLEAFDLINQIENLLRNFATIHLYESVDSPDNLLKDQVVKINHHGNGDFRDAHERAEEWKAMSNANGLATDMNPLIAYLSIQDLADLIRDLANNTGSQSWRKISRSLLDIRPIRDAVMHNQLIDVQALARLHDLRAEIYKAMTNN